jgi:hypothetical protein
MLPDLGLPEKFKELLHSYYRIKVKLHHNPSGYFDTYSFVHFSFGCLCRYLNINIYLFLLIIIVWEIVEHNIIFPNMFHQIKIHNIATDFGEYDTIGHSVADIMYACLGYYISGFYFKYNNII